MSGVHPTHYWARLKPYNPKREQLLQRCHFLGRVWHGGNGITEIPEWVKVNPAQANMLKRLKQNGTYGEDLDVKPAFDIVTPEFKARIDKKEEAIRKAALGYGAPNVSEMPDVSASESDASGSGSEPVGRITLEDLQDAPPPSVPVIEDADVSTDHVGTIAGVQSAPKLEPKEVDISGRVAAAEGFEQPGTHDLNDGQDVDEVAPRYAPSTQVESGGTRQSSNRTRGSRSPRGSRGSHGSRSRTRNSK